MKRVPIDHVGNLSLAVIRKFNGDASVSVYGLVVNLQNVHTDILSNNCNC